MKYSELSLVLQKGQLRWLSSPDPNFAGNLTDVTLSVWLSEFLICALWPDAVSVEVSKSRELSEVS